MPLAKPYLTLPGRTAASELLSLHELVPTPNAFARMAVRLFHRTPIGMMTTAAGQVLFELGEDVLSRFERA